MDHPPACATLRPTRSDWALGWAMRRRDFLLGGGAIVASVRAVLAQQPEQLRRIALLGDTPSDWAPWTVAFVGRLRELGWSDGFNIAIDYRWSEARPERLAEIVAELVKHKPDVIVTYGGAVPTLKTATTSIPIVFAFAVDPLGVGLVGNLSHPGGNTTGLSLQQNKSAGKRLEVLREIVPSLHRLGIMFDGGYRASVEESAQLQLMALKLGLAASPYEIRRAEDIAPAFDVLKGKKKKKSRLRSVPNCRRSAPRLISSEPGGSPLTGQIFRLCFAVLPSTSIKFCAVPSPAICQLSSQPNLI